MPTGAEYIGQALGQLGQDIDARRERARQYKREQEQNQLGYLMSLMNRPDLREDVRQELGGALSDLMGIRGEGKEVDAAKDFHLKRIGALLGQHTEAQLPQITTAPTFGPQGIGVQSQVVNPGSQAHGIFYTPEERIQQEASRAKAVAEAQLPSKQALAEESRKARVEAARINAQAALDRFNISQQNISERQKAKIPAEFQNRILIHETDFDIKDLSPEERREKAKERAALDLDAKYKQQSNLRETTIKGIDARIEGIRSRIQLDQAEINRKGLDTAKNQAAITTQGDVQLRNELLRKMLGESDFIRNHIDDEDKAAEVAAAQQRLEQYETQIKAASDRIQQAYAGYTQSPGPTGQPSYQGRPRISPGAAAAVAGRAKVSGPSTQSAQIGGKTVSVGQEYDLPDGRRVRITGIRNGKVSYVQVK